MKKKYQSNLLFSLLSKYSKLSSHEEKGYILVIAIGIVLAVSALLALYAKTTQADKITATSSLDSNTGFYAAESGLNLRAEQIRQIFVNYNTPTGTSPSSPTACLDANNSNDGNGDLQCQNYNFVSGNQNKSGHFATTYIVQKNNGQPINGVVPPGDQFQNLNMSEYTYSLYSLAFKDTSSESQAEAILQMDLKSRLIPMFQFAAFYKEDLEILPGPVMTLSGPVHTNGDLYLGGGNVLTIKGQVTTVGDIYSKRKNDNSTYADGRARIDDVGGTALNLLFHGTGSTTPTTDAMDPVRIATAWGTQVVTGINQVTIPEPSFLDSSGDYYTKADIRFELKPSSTNSSNMNYLQNVPFSLEVIPRTDSSGNAITSPTVTAFSEGQLRSLRQPVMVQPDLAAIATSSDYHLCQPLSYATDYDSSFKTWWDSLIDSEKRYFATSAHKAIIYAIQSQQQPLNYSLVTSKNSSESVTNLNSSYTNFQINFITAAIATYTAQKGLPPKPLDITNFLSTLTPAQIAALPYNDVSSNPVLPRCFVAAPVMEIGRDNASNQSPFRFHNERENREKRILQLNIQTMAVWNRDGIYLGFTGGFVTNHNNYEGFSANQLLYTTAAADASAPTDSFQAKGMAAIDHTQGGIVIYGTINSSTYPNAGGNQSPYGFAVVQGHQLFGLGTTTNNTDPTGITVASDQAMYLQGDYNTVNKQPAAILGDIFSPLSNACLNSDRAINHHTGINCDIDGSKVEATDTIVNAALVAGTDITNASGSGYNGGLENYPRFLENWSGNEWTYRGSFVSLSTPTHSSGNWSYGGDVYTAPIRNWDYDTYFNDANNLPPLTPQFVALKQESFIRSFEQ